MSCDHKHHILQINNLSVSFRQYENGRSHRQIDLPVISRLSVSVHEGEIVAVVGSSGSGKSLLAHAILDLLPYNAVCSGEIYFNGEPLDCKAAGEKHCLRAPEYDLPGSSDESGKTGKRRTGRRAGQKAAGTVPALRAWTGDGRKVSL